MTEREFERRVREFYLAKVEAAGPRPAALRERVWNIPDEVPYRVGYFQTRRGFMVLVAAMLMALIVAGAIAVGSAILRLPQDRRDRETVISPIGEAWVAYEVALTFPGYASTRIALVRHGDTSPTFLGGVAPPPEGTSDDEWESVSQACPSFSPDGSYLAYLESTKGSDVVPSRSRIVVTPMAADGAATRPLLEVRDVSHESCPWWSPDSQRVAYLVTNVFNDRPWIGITGLDGHESKIPTPDEWTDRNRIAWSHDGSAIALVTAFNIDATAEQGRLSVIPLDGGEPRVLLQGRGALRGLPSWSHDDTTIAITAALPLPEPSPDLDGSDAPAGKTWHVLAVPVDGPRLVRDLGRGNEPAFSPVDDRLAYIADAASGKFDDHSGIVVVDLGTGAEHLVPDAAIPDGTPLASGNYGGGHGVWFPHSPSWSADGRGLLYVGSDGNWGTSILLAASADADTDPVPFSKTWDQEWYGDQPYTVQPH